MADWHENGQLSVDITIKDPKARVEAYIELYKDCSEELVSISSAANIHLLIVILSLTLN